MKSNQFISRMQHAINRPSDALRRFGRRLLFKVAGVDFSKQTELQYVNLGNFDSKILKMNLLSSAKELAFGRDSLFSHNFNSKYQIEISNVIVNLENNLIYVTRNRGKESYLLAESSDWPTDRNLITSERPPHNQLPVINYGKIGLSSSGFYHLINEDLAALLMNKSEFPILNYQGNSKLVSQVLSMLNQEIIATPKWVFVENLSFVTRGLDLGYLHPEGLSSLRKYAQHTSVGQNLKEKIYVSRIGTRRSIHGEEVIAEHLANQGFKILKAENLTFKEQIELFLNVEILIGVHGAGLTNGIWTPRAKLIELMPSDRINRCFEWQSNLLESSYERILFNPEKPDIGAIIKKLDSLVHQSGI
jgi:hypothetical protein